MNLKCIMLFFAITLCLTILQPTTRINFGEPQVSYSIGNSVYYSAHASISIDSDQDFIDYGFVGNGSVENPFRIERLNITSSVSLGKAVSVRDTHAYFIIRDCYIVSEYIGIALLHVATGTGSIVNNTVISASGNGGGIVIQSGNCTISENRCVNFIQGIHLNEASHCRILKNDISNSNYQGINIRYSDNNTLIGNRIFNSTEHGLALVGTSTFNVVYNNTFIDNGNVAEYNIDGERTGDLTSQGYDEGSNNTWYDVNTNTGNLWSDYSGSGSYAIDGPASSVDPYPTIAQSSQDNTIIIISILTISVLAMVLIVVGSRRLHR